MSDDILLCSIEAGLARIHFNSPKTLNALSLPMARAFRDAALRVVADPTVRVILISAEGRAFMAGGDLRYFHDAEDKPGAAAELISCVNKALATLDRTQSIVLSAIQGAVAGGGIGIALSADIVLAADDVTFTTAYARIGATMDCGGSHALVRRAGYGKAIEMALLSDPLPVVEALSLGLVNRIVPRLALEQEAEALAARLLNGASQAQRNAKALLKTAATTTYPDQLRAELESFTQCAASEDFTEGVTAFLEKRKPDFAP